MTSFMPATTRGKFENMVVLVDIRAVSGALVLVEARRG
jgi:hypothetical protein